MKRKIKLRDMTVEQWDDYRNECRGDCDKCVFCFGNCFYSDRKKSWINHKEMYSDKFLDQEVEIEVLDILTKEEKEYLANVIKPFRDRVCYIKKVECINKYFISIKINSKFLNCEEEYIALPFFQNEMYKGMKSDKDYTLEDLGL